MSFRKSIKRIITEGNNQLYHIPSMRFVNYNWNTLVQFLEYEGFPKWSCGDSISLVYNPDVTSLHNLVHVEGNLDLEYCVNLESLGLLETVEGFLDIKDTKLTSLGKLKRVEDNLSMNRTNITTFGNLEYVGGILDATDCSRLANFGNLEYVGRRLELKGTAITDKFTIGEIRKIVNSPQILNN